MIQNSTRPGVLEINITTADVELIGRGNALPLGRLDGRYLVHSWPNAEQTLFVDARSRLPRPGAILDFGDGSEVSIEARPLLTDYVARLVKIQGDEMPGRCPTIQSQKLVRTQTLTLNDPNTQYWPDGGIMVCVDGIAFLRLHSTVSLNGDKVLLAIVDDDGAEYFHYPMATVAMNSTNAVVPLGGRVASGDRVSIGIIKNTAVPIVVDFDLAAGEV